MMYAKHSTARILLLCLLSNLSFLYGQNDDVYPLVIHAELPTYNSIARIARVSGTVQIEVTVKNGEVVLAEGKSGPQLLVASTIENVNTWHFPPNANAHFVTTFVYQFKGEETREMRNPEIEMKLPLFVQITAPPAKAPCEDCGPDPGSHTPSH